MFCQLWLITRYHIRILTKVGSLEHAFILGQFAILSMSLVSLDEGIMSVLRKRISIIYKERHAGVRSSLVVFVQLIRGMFASLDSNV